MLSENFLDDVPVHIGQAEISALEAVDEPFVINAQTAEHRGVQIVNVHGFLGNIVTEVVRFTVRDSALHTAASHPDGEATWVMVATVVLTCQTALAINCPAEFSAPNHEGIFEESPLFEVLNQGGGGLVDISALQRQIAWQRPVMVPTAVEDLNKSHVAFGQSAGE